jgi:type II secretory pathway component GspD/PulD (secretin)
MPVRAFAKLRGPAAIVIAVFLLAAAEGAAPTNAPAAAAPDADKLILEEVEFKGARVQDAVRTISELTGINIVATSSAGDKSVTLFIRKASVTNIVDSICRISGLWYRYNPGTAIFIVMTAEEYQKDIVVFRREPTRMFQLKYLNVGIAARTIADLFGTRVELLGRANSHLGDDFLIEDAFSGFSQDYDQGDAAMGYGGGGYGAGGYGGGRYGGYGSSSSSRYGYGGRSGSRARGRESRSYTGRDQLRDENLGLEDKKLSPSQLARLEDMAKADPQRASAAKIDPQRVSTDIVEQVTQTTTEAPIYVTLNRLHNMLFVRTADEKAMEEIARIVQESDQQIPEVLLEMKVLEVQLTDRFESAFNISAIGGKQQTGPDDGQAVNPLNPRSESVGSYLGGIGNHPLQAGSTAVFQILSGNLRARLQLLEQNNNVRTLATPMLLAANNHPARLFIGEETVLTTGFETQTSSAEPTVANVVVNTLPVPITEVRSIGNTLTILPSINADRSVVMRLIHENSTVQYNGGSIPLLVGTKVESVPIDTVNTSTLGGTVLAMDGMTVAVGGMMRTSHVNNETKVPVLGNIPVLGFFFKEKLKSEVKTELVLLITPHVLSVPEQGEEVTRRRLRELIEHPSELDIYLDSLERSRSGKEPDGNGSSGAGSGKSGRLPEK